MSLWKLINARWGSGAGETDEIRMDASTNTLQTLTYEHHEIHSGSHYYLSGHEQEASAGTIEFVFTTHATIETHLVFEVEGSASIQIDLFEGSSSVVGGAATTPFNNNRNSGNSAVTTVIKDPTSITDGTLIDSHMKGANKTSGNVGRENEIVLDLSNVYLLRITSGAINNDIDYRISWYEHTPKH